MVEPVEEMVAWRPAPALRPLVAGYSGWRHDGLAPRVHRGLPSRHLTVVLGLDGPVEVAAASDPTPRAFDAPVGGLHDAPARVAQPSRQEGVQLSLTPAGARALLGLPAAALASSVVDLRDLLGADADALVERLAATSRWPERFEALDGALAARAGRGEAQAGVPDAVAEAWRRLVTTGGGVAVADLAREVGWSRRQLTERFRREIGLPPKVLGRVVRFEAARRRLGAPDRPSLADVAAAAGYADHSHLVRDWHAFAGCAPSRWIAEELPSVQDASGAPGAG